MSLLRPHENRNVVPRWRPTRAGATSRELSPARPTKQGALDFRESVRRRELDFAAHANPWTAADLLSTIRTAGLGATSSLESQAISILEQGPFRPDVIERLTAQRADRVDEPDLRFVSATELDEHARFRVHRLRAYLREHPRSALRWLDLALAHVTLGNTDQATRAIRAALAIAPDNRLVLRSSSRFFVHANEFGEALRWLSSSDRLQSDPWLLAAHIAVSQLADVPIRLIRTARELLIDNSVSPFSASELAAALASEELRAGREKRARGLMLDAVRDPTDNALAQAVWARDHGLADVGTVQSAPRAYEAEALASVQVADWRRAQSAVASWIADEPFSLSAAVNASYVALTGLEDYALAVEYAEVGLRTHPLNPILLNNAAFASARLGHTDEADQYLSLATSNDPEQEATLTATRGLTRFRAGDVGAGRALYRQATADLIKSDARDLANLCQIMWSFEEARAQTDLGRTLYSQLIDVPTKTVDAQVWMKRLRRQLRTASE